jgi:hypothetical protein
MRKERAVDVRVGAAESAVSSRTDSEPREFVPQLDQLQVRSCG